LQIAATIKNVAFEFYFNRLSGDLLRDLLLNDLASDVKSDLVLNRISFKAPAEDL